MYQYITAVLSGIAGLKEMLKANKFSNNIFSFFSRKANRKSYLGVIFLGFAFTSSLLLLLISIESVVFYIPAAASQCVGTITAFSAIIMIGVLVKHEILNKKFSVLNCDFRQVKKENKVFEEKVSNLVTYSDIARAAASSKTFGCFMGSIARLLRADKAAQELTIFTYNEEKFLPHTYYQFSDYSELCLSFSQKDILNYFKASGDNINFDSRFFSADNLALEYIDSNITIEGSLLLNRSNIGRLRVTLFECTDVAKSLDELLEGIVQNALLSVKIEFDGVLKSLEYEKPILSEVSNSSAILMLRLEVEEVMLGAVKLKFFNSSANSITRQKLILKDASSHISKALYNQRLYEFAVRDGLTDLYNKRYFMEILDNSCKNYMMGSDSLSLMLIDIDYFKNVNDTWGHLTGDNVLKKVSSIVAETARESDIAARYGGEELVVLMPNTEINGAKILAERIRETIEKEVFEAANGESFSITASFGVSEMENGMLSSLNLIEDADKCLYMAKNNGRNQVIANLKEYLVSSAA